MLNRLVSKAKLITGTFRRRTREIFVDIKTDIPIIKYHGASITVTLHDKSNTKIELGTEVVKFIAARVMRQERILDDIKKYLRDAIVATRSGDDRGARYYMGYAYALATVYRTIDDLVPDAIDGRERDRKLIDKLVEEAEEELKKDDEYTRELASAFRKLGDDYASKKRG